VEYLQQRPRALLVHNRDKSCSAMSPTFAVVNVVMNVAVNISKVRSGTLVHRNLFEMMTEVRQRLGRGGHGASVSLHRGGQGL
jgi:hypothetical protein